MARVDNWQWAQCIDCSWSWRWCEPDNIKMWLQMLSGCCPSLSAASLSPLCRCSVGHRGNGPVAVVEFLDWHWYYDRIQCTEQPSLCWKLATSYGFQTQEFKFSPLAAFYWILFACVVCYSECCTLNRVDFPKVPMSKLRNSRHNLQHWHLLLSIFYHLLWFI